MSGLADASIEFVILTWNSERYVRACLESVLGLRARCLRVHVVDNGSVDGTLQILDELAGAHPELSVIREPTNLGMSVSRNIALAHIGKDSDFVCVLDSDTVVNQNAFDTLADVVRDDATIGIVGPVMSSSLGVKQLSGRNLPTLAIKLGKAFPAVSVRERAAAQEVPSAPIENGLQDVGYLLGACMMMPRKTISMVGGFDEKIFYGPEDVDYCLRVHEAGLRVVYCERASIIHEYQRISKKRLFSSTNIAHLKGLIHFFKKHRYLNNAPRF